MKVAIPTPSPNGHEEAPPETSGASFLPHPRQRAQTEFLADAPLRSLHAVYYALHRFLAGGVPLSRLVSLLLLAGAAIWATGLMPGRWTGTAVLLLLLAAHVGIAAALRRRDFVEFRPSRLDETGPAPLSHDEKIPAYVTGLLSVEGKYQRFTFLPAFYRTFATGEHALLALVRGRSLWGLAAWPEDEAGMWYAFISPDHIQALRTGMLRFGAQPLHGIAIDYTVTLPAKNRLRRERTTTETIYIAASGAEDAKRIVADLLCNVEASALLALQSTPIEHK